MYIYIYMYKRLKFIYTLHTTSYIEKLVQHVHWIWLTSPYVNLVFFWLFPRSHSHDRWQNGCFASTMTQARCGVFRSGVASAFSLRLWALTGESCIFWDYITSSGGGGQKNKGMSQGQTPKLAFLRWFPPLRIHRNQGHIAPGWCQ